MKNTKSNLFTCNMSDPSFEGESETITPAASSAATFVSAVPFPPEIIAPACPIRLPGGAVRPAINETTGFGDEDPKLYWAKKSAASSSALPPISPIRIIPSVLGSSKNNRKQSMKFVPLNGSPPIPMHRVWPSPTDVVCATASYVNVPDLETIPFELLVF